MPQWFSNDYFEIKTDGIEDSTLFLDTEKRMLYNIIIQNIIKIIRLHIKMFITISL